MKCSPVKIGKVSAIVCGRDRIYHCIECGEPAPKLGDWRMSDKRAVKIRTCDRPLCEKHTYQPAPDKDLCPAHAKLWQERLAAKKAVNA